MPYTESMEELLELTELDLVDAFLRLRNRQTAGLGYREILDTYWDHIPVLPSLVIPCYSDSPEILFRALKYEEPPEDIGALSHPPRSLTNLGRLNLPNHPVFYASDKPLISILEIGGRPGETVYVGSWRVRDFNNIYIWPLLVDYGGDVPVLKKQKNLILGAIDRMGPKLGSRYLQLVRQTTELLLGNKAELTSAIGHFMFNDADPVCADICIYPSIQGYRQHANFAFGLEMVNSRFEFIGATCLEILEINEPEGYGRFRCTRQGFPDSSTVKWKDENKSPEMTLAIQGKI